MSYNLFPMTFDPRGEDDDWRERRHEKSINDSIIVPPSLRKKEPSKKKKKSRYYIRPVFKEPGSKIGMPLLAGGDDDNANDSDDLEEVAASRHRMTIVHELRDEVGRILAADAAADAIQPSSRTQDRLKHIVGRPPPPILGLENTTSLRNRRLIVGRDAAAKQPGSNTKYSESLETRRLCDGYTLEKQYSDASTIRREVNKIVDTTIFPGTNEPQHIPTAFAARDARREEESRDEMPLSIVRGDPNCGEIKSDDTRNELAEATRTIELANLADDDSGCTCMFPGLPSPTSLFAPWSCVQ